GSPGRFALRPEKIRLLEAEEEAAPGWHSVVGTVREVVYLGMSTRYAVAVPEAGELTAVEQNSGPILAPPHAAVGRPVRLAWDPSHCLSIPGSRPESREHG
ncbi:MAG TPA: TOBE domain-containing protein, partial [Thermoanaerobaculia bacterium]|nr:TOBE domain-containing protein [Thermoanaerobaculia bacterium]